MAKPIGMQDEAGLTGLISHDSNDNIITRISAVLMQHFPKLDLKLLHTSIHSPTSPLNRFTTESETILVIQLNEQVPFNDFVVIKVYGG
jgi:hypothetical protein